jgi:hypothetical protein
MLKLKQGVAAVALVTSLGLIVPAFFGGPALADVKPPPNGGKTPPNDHARNPLYVETVFHCDLDGEEGYEVPYEAVTTHQFMWQVKNSPTVIVKRHNVDTIYSRYTVLRDDEHDPPDEAVDFDDPDVYWSNGPYPYPDPWPKGWKTVRCTADFSYRYTATAEDADLPNLSFVEGVTYIETDTELFEVTISGNGPKAKAASADDGASAERKTKKNGKHKGKGKRGR